MADIINEIGKQAKLAVLLPVALWHIKNNRPKKELLKQYIGCCFTT